MNVAHVLKYFEAGGVEKWLVDFTECNVKNSNKLNLYYFLQSSSPSLFDEDVKKNGGVFVYNELNKGLYIFIYLVKLFIQLKKHKIEVLHTHVYTFSGLVALVGFFAGVKKIVVHSHNDKSANFEMLSFFKKTYIKIMKLLIDRFSTSKIAVSEEAANSLFGSVKGVYILPCGLNFDLHSNRYMKSNATEVVKILHIGSFSAQKNHRFMISICESLIKKKILFEMHLIGDGPDFDLIKNEAISKGVDKNLYFHGKCRDIYDFICSSSFNVFILPSLFEGLGLVAVESQFFGMKTLVSDRVPSSVSFSSYIDFLPINPGNESLWVDGIVSNQTPSLEDVTKCRSNIAVSKVNINNNYQEIVAIYEK